MILSPHRAFGARLLALAVAAGALLFLSIPSVRAAEPWPAETWQEAEVLTQLDSDFANNLSGAYWNPETRTLWVCLNGPARFWALVEDGAGTGFTIDTQDGRAGEWSVSGDLEGITQVDPLDPSIYVINEASDAVEQYDVSVYGSPVFTQRWNLAAYMPTSGGSGSEGITFVPDRWLALAGFVDGAGAPYVSRNGMGGLMLVSHQNGGRVYAFDLDPFSSAYDFIGAYRTSRGESSGLEFDAASGKLFVWHNTGSNYLEMCDLSSYVRGDGERQFTTVAEYVAPRSGNLEGIAIPPLPEGDGWCFITDDDNQSGGALSWYRTLSMAQVGHDRYTVPAGGTLQVAAPGVRVNDSGPSTAALLLAEPARGTLLGLDSGATFDGSFVYVPDAGFAGTDVFTYKAADGDTGSAEASVLIDVLEDGGEEPPQTLEVRVGSANDDAEEATDGRVNLTSTDLELTREATQQTIGFRFASVDLPARARIVEAWVQFTVDETASEATAVTLRGEAAAAAAAYTSTTGNITARQPTAAAVSWEPPAWDVVGEAGAAQRTPDVAAVVQEIVDGAGWTAGNPLAFLVTGSGKRVAESYNGSPSTAPALHVAFYAPEDACTPGGCDDGDACTNDACKPATGCVFTAIGCDDSDACTNDSCDARTGCVFTAIGCDDGDACTNDACKPATGCVSTAIGCDDGDACTNDSCDARTGCVFTAIGCDDGDPCTNDLCDPSSGCTFPFHTDPCDDGDVCTEGDRCDGAGTCVGVDACSSSPHLWTGSVTSTAGWTRVDLGRKYEEMVVVCTPGYGAGATPVVSRVLPHANGAGFDVAASSADATGALRAGVRLSCLAVEAGRYTLDEHGVRMEAATFTSTVTDSKSSWLGESRSYQNAYAQPVVVGQVMSYNDPAWSVFWCRGKDRSSPPGGSLGVGKHVGEDPDVHRADELLGYLVIESGTGTMEGVAYTAELGADTIRGVDSSPPFTYAVGGIDATSTAVATIGGMDGNNGGWAILYGASPFSAGLLPLAIDEDRARDSERKHTTEQVGFLVFDDGGAAQKQTAAPLARKDAAAAAPAVRVRRVLLPTDVLAALARFGEKPAAPR